MYFLLFIIILFLCWPLITRWLRGFMARRMEDTIRKMAGMPPRKEEEKSRRRRERERTGRKGKGSGGSGGKSGGGPIIPREYAVDVEFTETIDYSEEIVIGEEGHHRRVEYHESQVSDVQFVEIKDKT